MAKLPMEEYVEKVESGPPAPEHEVTTGKMDAITRKMANRATATEHELGYWEAFKIYKKGAFWSMFISLSIIMRAYDIEISGNFYALPAFQQAFGSEVSGRARWTPRSTPRRSGCPPR